MKREFRRHSSVRNRLRTEDDITTWLTSNQHFLLKNNNLIVFFKGSDISDDSDSTLTEEPRYLNGGYGWIVVAFSFLLHFIADGLSFSFGVLFPKIQEEDYFNWRHNLHNRSVNFVFLLIYSNIYFVLRWYNWSRYVIFEALFIAYSTIVINFEEKILAILTFWLSLVYNAAIVMVTYNFELRRGLATALAVSGTGVGTIIFPFFMNYVYLIATRISITL
uniref:CLN3 protein n=1 Tax=Heterorhabditis bacteriophora TaxID=37862 RepID=A0A1I7X958_HETBA